jgi:predicted phosphodiesterase
MLNKAYSAIDYLDEYDSVIFLGDSAPTADNEDDAIKNTIAFMGKVSGGEKPAIYVRGNHETRGAYANDLPSVLGLDELYYTLNVGDYSFIVLDSGEDKEDSHSEYGGLTAYGDYRKAMIEWLKTADTNSDKVIALSHAWEISEVEEDLAITGWNEIDRMGARLMISGHTHQCGFVNKEAEGINAEIFSAHPHIDAYMDGGKSDKDYIASMLTLSPEAIGIRAVNQNGEEIINEEMKW